MEVEISFIQIKRNINITKKKFGIQIKLQVNKIYNFESHKHFVSNLFYNLRFMQDESEKQTL